MLPSGIKKYDNNLDPPLWDEFRFLGNIDLSERPFRLIKFSMFSEFPF